MKLMNTCFSEHSYFYPWICFLCFWVEKVRTLFHFLEFFTLWTSPSEGKTTCSFYSSDHTTPFNL